MSFMPFDYTNTNYINPDEWDDDINPEDERVLFVTSQDERFIYGFFWRYKDDRKFGCKMKIDKFEKFFILSPVQ
jgi:hypothetical protein